MFRLFKKKTNNNKILSPVKGKVIPVSEIPDPVFSQKMAGDGVGILIEDDVICAPTDGTLSIIFKTKHAFAMTLDNGIELLVHIGIETVSLNGEGFEVLAKEGQKVTTGTPIIKVDREFIKSKGLSLATPVLITNIDIVDTITTNTNIDSIEGETTIIQYSLK